MDFKNLMDKAKDAANAAANKVQEAATTMTQTAPAQAPAEGTAPAEAPAEGEQAVVVVTTTEQTVVTTTAPAGKSFSAIANEKLTQLSQAGSDKIQELVTSFQQSLQALKSAGYEITEFEVELGSKQAGYMINKTYIKFWPAEYHAQSSIDAALQLRQQFMNDNYSWKDITRMEMESFEAAVSIIGIHISGLCSFSQSS